jgi:transposase
MGKGASTEQVVRDIHRRTRRRFSAEEKVRIVLEGLRGEQSVAELCRRESLAPNLYYLYGPPRARKREVEDGAGRLAYLYPAS